jgi:hypothetical protein
MDAVKLFALVSCAACTITSIEEPAGTTAGTATSAITIKVISIAGDGTTVDAKIDLVVGGLHATLGAGDSLRLVDGVGGSAAFALGDGDFETKLATTDIALSVELVRNGVVATTLPTPLPPPFAPGATSSSRAAGIMLSWQSAPAFPMEIVATGTPCLPPDGFTTHLEPETGAFEIQPADMITSPGACDIVVVFTRGVQQTQTRTVSVPTTP